MCAAFMTCCDGCWLWLVCFAEHQVSLVTADGGKPHEEDGSDAAAVLLYNSATQETTRLERNDTGGFYRLFQHNKWVARKQAEAAQKAAEQQAQAVLVSSSS